MDEISLTTFSRNTIDKLKGKNLRWILDNLTTHRPQSAGLLLVHMSIQLPLAILSTLSRTMRRIYDSTTLRLQIFHGYKFTLSHGGHKIYQDQVTYRIHQPIQTLQARGPLWLGLKDYLDALDLT